MLTDAQQRNAAKKLAAEWNGRGYEKGETHAFWMELLHMVCGVVNPAQFITFESQVQLGHTSFIDAYIPETKVMIEQKSLDVDLNKPAKQSDGSMLTPYQQAKRYADQLPNSQRPRYIVVCNFQTFHVHDMEHPHDEPEVIQLADLPKEYHRLAFLTDVNKAHLKREMELSIKAGEIVGKIYDCILKHYHDPSAESTLKSLNMLCVRLVFCLYAEDAGIFVKDQFHDYLARFDARDIRRALIDLFKVLDTKEAERDPYLDDDLAAFPYVNGGLFAETDIEIPQFDDTVKELLLAKASDDFNWSEISPTIFGAVFESTLNPETRRSGGMHYTSIENIHKVIDPLFLDDLKAELEEILSSKAVTTRNKKLFAFQDKLSGLTFLDPACGSGNFLTETYLSLRKLENKCLEVINAGQTVLGFDDVIKVSIGQFYGIEINDFAVTVAKTALWIAESQMMKATEDIVHMDLDFLPLKSYANIIEANALRIDWNTVIPKEKLHYIMGNPPFVGYKFQSKEQKNDIELIASDFANYGTLDYVSAWYIKTARLIKNTDIKCAFVSTNSVVQGEHVNTLWKPLLQNGNQIEFAHRTFRWDSEANGKAHVHCVIIGFASQNVRKNKLLYDEDGNLSIVESINGYLQTGDSFFIDKRTKPWRDDTPIATKGNAAMDDGHLCLSENEYLYFIEQEPQIKSLIKQHMSADDFLKGTKHFCIWLKDIPQSEYSDSRLITERLAAVKVYRNSSNRAATKKMADYPMLFAEVRQPDTDYIMIPVVSSEKRKYIPMAYLSPEIINSYASISVPGATLFHFGVLESIVHMAWMRKFAGRLKSDYRYSSTMIYNTFPWCEATAQQKEEIAKTAQAILDARAKETGSTLAKLYEDSKMPPELRKAHQANDKAVMKAYGYAPSMTEPEIVADLMKRYQELAKVL